MIEPTLMTRIRNDLDTWEHPVTWMYLDSVGIVTVGCGTALESESAAADLPFVHSKTLGPAGRDDIIAAWRDLHAAAATQKSAVPKQKHAARFYEAKSDLRITLQTASDLRDAHVLADYASLQRIYPDFDAFPEDAKLALFDMIYNLGAGRSGGRHRRATGLRQYGTMNAAITRGDWTGAASTCLRRGIPAERNAMTAALFRKCAMTDTRPRSAASAHPAAASHTGHAHKAHRPHRSRAGHAIPHATQHPGLPNVRLPLP
jgi:GH24 family phage-related lysozyme (muramidase)